MENNKIRVALAGAGNVATSLAVALRRAGADIVALWSRSEEAARLLGERIDVPYHTVLSEMPETDVVIISVTDSAIPAVAESIATKYPNAVVMHTAGSVNIDVLRNAGCKRYAVLYPMQTFSKVRIVDFSAVSIFVEGACEDDLLVAEEIASLLTSKVYRVTSERRASLHLAAVFACNFSNAAYIMAAELLKKNGLPFDAMLPLIDETASKVHEVSPLEAQTGPAKRGDTIVMEQHAAMLDGDLKEAYELFSKYIQKKNNI